MTTPSFINLIPGREVVTVNENTRSVDTPNFLAQLKIDLGKGIASGFAALNSAGKVIDAAQNVIEAATVDGLGQATTVAKSLLKATTAQAMRAVLGFPDAAISAVITDFLDSADAVTARTAIGAGTGSGSGTTDLTGVPIIIGKIGGVYRMTASGPVGRPAADRPVWFDGDTQPTNDGAITGGGGMVPDGTLSGGQRDKWINP